MPWALSDELNIQRSLTKSVRYKISKIQKPKGLKKSHGNKKGFFIQQNVQTFVKQSKVEEAINAANSILLKTGFFDSIQNIEIYVNVDKCLQWAWKRVGQKLALQ